MLARISLLSIAAVVAAAAPAAAQCMQRMQMQSAARQYAAYSASLAPQLPNMQQLASQRYVPYGGFEQGCSTAREQQMQARTAQMQQRREAEQARRKTAREQLPRPAQDPEKQAASKFELAHLLWQRGNTPGARKWLDEIVDKFPSTQTADRARLTLARL